ncbi:helix-turn-helix domain-containing protein [Delftia tsuruhatensis]|jgi:predicted DNA-binding transcriptional regulator AlpA|uniref:helix-turn-helix transcriptional regulator n=1 Tax=Delftia TaxID=80865 RepID=UPI001E36679F|nr:MULTISPECIES: helix-turn-helix domain-containing protein [Delftia]MDH0777158.1 helix-turn-helix domain-containing protein [Delftia tsuruhatensis]MDH1461156.1 helix-turn-helix domain-containing protein [Delftia tsuruhatensis]MDH1827086.1 helix-turn-helix domain-containing protein [Delftia tsuruhatensis]WGG09047.1 helix-turn-helix domain-containing protein [Delftia tsuruhatensis]
MSANKPQKNQSQKPPKGTNEMNPHLSTAPRMDTQGIAEYLGLSREHVTARLTKRPDFPKPFINASRRIRYWRVADVKAWAEGRH